METHLDDPSVPLLTKLKRFRQLRKYFADDQIATSTSQRRASLVDQLEQADLGDLPADSAKSDLADHYLGE